VDTHERILRQESRMNVERLPPLVTSLKPSNLLYVNGATVAESKAGR
jgi:hypothetical protein